MEPCGTYTLSPITRGNHGELRIAVKSGLQPVTFSGVDFLHLGWPKRHLCVVLGSPPRGSHDKLMEGMMCLTTNFQGGFVTYEYVVTSCSCVEKEVGYVHDSGT